MGEHGRWLRAYRRRGVRGRLHSARKALEVLARMMDRTDPETQAHGFHVAGLVPRVGRALGIRGAALEELELAAEFHDIGKVAVPTEVLRKPGPLDELERQVMVCHVEWGAELLRHLPECETIAEIVRHHHERYDGTGYPDGLKGCEIPLASRVIATCDAYGAMMADRPYRKALGREVALRELAQGAGTQFDPDAVAVVMRLADPRDDAVASGP